MFLCLIHKKMVWRTFKGFQDLVNYFTYFREYLWTSFNGSHVYSILDPYLACIAQVPKSRIIGSLLYCCFVGSIGEMNGRVMGGGWLCGGIGNLVLKRLFVMLLFSRVEWKGDRAVKRESCLGRESKAKGWAGAGS